MNVKSKRIGVFTIASSSSERASGGFFGVARVWFEREGVEMMVRVADAGTFDTAVEATDSAMARAERLLPKGDGGV